jgi:putative tryptophan/tyrosine transport system substrate-binding protein
MNRRVFLGGLSLVAFAPPLAADTEPAKKMPLIGVIHTENCGPGRLSVDSFRQGLRDHGYVEGQTIVVDCRSGYGKPELLPRLAAELVERHVDLLYMIGPAAVRAAKDATQSIPIVAVDLESDPVQSGFVRSIARPGGNITGLFLDLPSLTGKWLELIRQAVPRIREVALLWDATTGSAQLTAARATARSLGMDVQVLEIRSAGDLDEVLRAGFSARGLRALVQLGSPTISVRAPRIAEFTTKNRLPGISPFPEFARAGGLMAYGLDQADFFRRSASYVDKILKGAKPGDLPIEQPTKFELVINLKTAKALGLTISPSLVLRADELIQ